MVSSRKNWPVLLVPVLLAALFAAGCATIPGETPPDGIWSDLGEPSEGLVAVLIGNHWGYADEAGELVVAPQFSQALPFSNGRAAVRLTTRWGFIDRQGTYVVRPMYESAGSYAEGLAPVKTKKGWGYIDAGGHMAIPPEYDEAGPFSEDSAAVRTGSRWGYIAKDGRVLIEFNFKEAGRFSDGKAPVATLSDDNEWGYIDHDGRFVIPPTFDEARSFSEGRAAVQVDGRWGFIDGSGTLVVNPQFDDAGDFTRLWEPMDTRAPARKDGLWGLLSEDGSFAVPPRWAALGNFHDGQARAVSEDDRVALIDAAANEAEIRGSLRHAAVPPTRAVAAAGSDTVLVRIQVVDYLGGKAVKGYKIAATLGTYGWADIPNPPESDGSGNVVLLMERDRWEQTRTVFGKKDGWFSADLEVPDHKVLSHVLKVLSLDARLPRIDEVLCTQDKVSTNVLIQQAEFEFKKPGAVTFDFTTWAGALKIHKYFLQQGTKRIESDSPRFDVEVGRSFSVDDVISAGIIIDYRDMAIAMPTLIKIRKNPELEKPVEYPPTPPATMMGDIPFIAGTSGVLQLPGLQFGIVYGNDIVTLYYGLNPEAEKEKSPGWEGPFKSLMNEVANGSPNLNKIWEYYTGKNPIPNPGGKGTFKAAAGAMGYVELSYGPKGLEVVGGRLVIFGKFGYEFTAQTMVTVIPVYASFGLGGDLAVKFALDGPPKSYKDFFQDVTIVVAPYVDCEGGVGVKGLLSIGLALHGAIQMNFLVSRQDFNGKMTLDFFLRARALFIFTWEK
ncbi:MAG: WG repeat-containing protein, partial [Spirochaetia bacterium]